MQMIRSRRSALALGCTLALGACLAGGLSACGGAPAQGSASGSAPAAEEQKTVLFTDSAGREVEVPAVIDKVVPSGHTATQVLLTIAPDKLAGVSQELSESQQKYLGHTLDEELPVLGAAFGSKGNLNKEAVAATGAQILIDTGEYKEGIAEELDELQEQLGIPCVFIESKLDEWGDAYRTLGDLLGEPERGEELASYCEDAYAQVNDVMQGIPASERARVVYCVGDAGTNVIANGSFQANVVDMLADNVAVVDAPSSKGSGNEVSVEQIAAWNPEVVLFGALNGSVTPYDTVASDAAWSALPAIQNGSYYEVPSEPYGWLNNPPTVNQVLGMQWLARVLYPAQFEGMGSEADVVREYFQVVYGYELTDAELAEFGVEAK